ncbi:MAG: bifunctional diguanylate cyclase/phosphodiesterase [Frankiaceae bacterium]|nr:bifunctional diguanylate cyclase/phosphodiesterase [Frankiaceae bacterium]
MSSDSSAVRGLSGMRARWACMPLSGRLHVVVGTVLAGAVAVMVIEALALRDTPVPDAWRLLLIACLLPLSERALLHVRFGAHQYSFTWGEACIVIGFATIPPSWVVLIAGPTVTAVHLTARRGWLKSLFNGAAFTASAAVAAAGVQAYAVQPYLLTDPRDAVVLFLSVTMFSATSAILTSVVVAVAQQRSPRAVLAENGRMLLAIWAGNVLAATAMLLVVETNPVLLVGVPPVMAGVYAAYRGLLSTRQERDMWQQFEAATRELNQLEETDIARVALNRAAQLFKTDRVELFLFASGQRTNRLYSREADERVVCETMGDAVPGGPGRTVFVEVGREGDATSEITCIEAPLEGPKGRVGSLRLLFDGPVKLNARERHVLRTYAHAVSTTVLNAGLYDDVRAEAIRHAYEASHDPLTGLANRVLLQDEARKAIAGTDGTSTALLLLDLDHFKEINDTLGHAAGDFLLQRVADRLRSAAGPSRLVSRLGGDEFAILLTGLAAPEEAEPVAESLLRVLAEPVEFEGLRLSVEGSLGVACHPHDAGDAEELFRRADVAMYQAKTDRGSWVRYDIVRDDSSVYRLALVAELRSALETDQIIAHFQPQASLDDGTIIGAEALARWQHPTRGLLPPSEFVGVTEQSGLVRPFTLRMLDLAIAQCARWQAIGRPVTVAVNLAARSLLDRQLPQDVAYILQRHGLPASCLVLEITETTATSELEVVEEILGALRRLGVGLSVDDFGTGYSSLAFLQRTAVNELKVDRSFVSGMLQSDNDLALVRATVQLAHSLGARAVAEGVEDGELAAALLALGCDMAQGYWLSPPVAPEELEKMLGLGSEREHRFDIPLPRFAAGQHIPVTRLRAVER